MSALSRRLRALERRVGGAFETGGPPVDQDGLPSWDGSTPLTVEGYERALSGDVPNAELTEAELEARERLAPYASVFEQLARDATEKEAGT